MEAQDARPAEDATATAQTPADAKEASSTDTPIKRSGLKARLLGWLWANIWRKDGRKREHIPDMPVWIGVLRVLQFALSVGTVGLTAYGTAEVQRALGYRRITNWSGAEGYPFSWFTFSWSFCYLVWLGTAVLLLPMMYNCWVQLGLELLTTVFWLIATSLLASHTDDLDDHDDYVTELGPAFKKYQAFIQEHARGFVLATFAATGTAAVNSIFFIITLVCFGRALHNYRVRTSPSFVDQEKAPSPIDDPDKIVAPAHMSGASSGQPPWAHHHHYHYWPPHLQPQANGQPPQGYPYMPGYYPAPGQPYPPQPVDPAAPPPPANGQSPYQSQPTYPPHSPWGSPPPGTMWPQHNYDLYQQQVPIAAQHTGQTGDYGSPQFPAVAPVAPTKAGLDGGTPPQQPPLRLQTMMPQRQATASPAELQSGVVPDNNDSDNMPAELPPHDPPPATQGQQGPEAAKPA